MSTRMGRIGLCLALLMTGLLMGCNGNKISSANQSNQIEQITQLDGKRIGIVVGSTYDEIIRRCFPGAEEIYLESIPDAIVALQNGRIDSYITDEVFAYSQMDTVAGISRIPGYITQESYAFIVNSDNKELQTKLNTVLKQMKEDGRLDELRAKWIAGLGEQRIEANPDADTSNGELHIISCNDLPPFCYMQDDQLVGYDIEIITRAAEQLGYSLSFETAIFAALIPSVVSKKADIGVGCITVTEERSASVLFTEPVYESGAVAVVRTGSEIKKSVLDQLVESFFDTFTGENGLMVLNGLLVTVALSVASLFLGTVFGVPVSFLLLSRNRLVRIATKAISTFLSRMPQVLTLVLLYYGVFRSAGISAAVVGIICFTLDFSNTVGGLLSAGVHAVKPGEIEAAKAMGYSSMQIYLKIILPQAAYYMFPQYEGAVLSLVKGTAIIGYITVGDLTKAGDMIRNSTYDAFFPLLATAALYFLIAKLLIIFMKYIAVRLNPKRRRMSSR